jgi:hypothetical protein
VVGKKQAGGTEGEAEIGEGCGGGWWLGIVRCGGCHGSAGGGGG